MGIMIAGIVVVGIYSFFLIRRGLKFWLKRDSGIFLNIVNLIMAAVVIFCCADIWSISAVIVLHIIAVALLIDIAALLAGKIFKRFQEDRNYLRVRKIYLSGMLPLLFSAAIFTYGFWNMQFTVRTEYQVETSKEVEDYKIILLTDTHYGTIQSPDILKQGIDAINDENPDLVILGEDIVEEGTSKEMMEEIFQIVGNMETKYGVNILDNMIAPGDIPPVIVVSATFDAENQPQSFSRSVEELSVFHNDLRENLMPNIEERFHTYAEDITKEGFEAFREHRAFGEFSLGAATTWYQFIHNLDTIKNFVPMSGDCWIMGTYGRRYYPVETVDYLEDMLSEGGYEEDDFRIYQGIGTDDPIWDQTDSQIQEMFTRETFTPRNLHYAIIEGGRHDMDACERYLYYALQDFFGGEA